MPVTIVLLAPKTFTAMTLGQALGRPHEPREPDWWGWSERGCGENLLLGMVTMPTARDSNGHESVRPAPTVLPRGKHPVQAVLFPGGKLAPACRVSATVTRRHHDVWYGRDAATDRPRLAGRITEQRPSVVEKRCGRPQVAQTAPGFGVEGWS